MSAPPPSTATAATTTPRAASAGRCRTRFAGPDAVDERLRRRRDEPVPSGGTEDRTPDRIDLGRPARLPVLLHGRPEVRRDALDLRDHPLRVELDAVGTGSRGHLAHTAFEPFPPDRIGHDAAEIGA